MRRPSSGATFSVWEPSVPRIPDEYLDCVIYLYPTEVDAEDGGRAGGSGFLVGVPTEGLRQNFWILYAVSNKHVIEKSRVVRMNTADGRKTIVPSARADWIVHPDGDDVAAFQISFDPKEFKFNHVPRASFVSKEIVDRYKIGPGDDAFMVGRFANHEGRQQNLPTVRFGNIAQMPWEAIKQDGNGFEQESFLVEMRSINGYSGSPVFVYIPIFSDRPGLANWNIPPSVVAYTGKPYGSLKSHGPWLLGVDWGHMNDWSPVRRSDGKPVNPNPMEMHVKVNTGLAPVVPAWKLAEILDTGPLAENRKEIERQVMENEEKNPQMSTLVSLETTTPSAARPTNDGNCGDS